MEKTTTLSVSIRFWLEKNSIKNVEEETTNIFYSSDFLCEGDFKFVGKKEEGEVIFRGAANYDSKEKVKDSMKNLVKKLEYLNYDIAHAIAYSSKSRENEIVYSLLNGEL